MVTAKKIKYDEDGEEYEDEDDEEQEEDVPEPKEIKIGHAS